jgi:2-polyprenyl-3-methyl-5-hydroxy-6-metoxy-1,4-benzoquinol methylase
MDDALSRRSLFRLEVLTARTQGRPSVEPVKASIATRWEFGGEPLMRAWEPLATVLCDAAGELAGRRMLDAAAGDGNVALEAARRGAEVRAHDLSQAQVDRGRARAEAAGLEVQWTLADVEELPDFDATYDVVLSSYGATLAPRPKRTVRELLRVLRPGGVLVMGAAAPHSLTDRAMDLAQEGAGALPDGLPAPGLWGREDVARQRILAIADDTDIETRLHAHTLRFESEQDAWDAFSRPFALPPTVRDRFADEVSLRSESRSTVEITDWVLLVIARRPGEPLS